MINKKIALVGLIAVSTVLLSSCIDKDDKKVMDDKMTNHESMEDSMEKNREGDEMKKMIPVEGDNGIGDGAEPLDEVMMRDDMMRDDMMKNMLTDKKGMTLYIFKKDIENVSNCSGECEVKWPVYYNEELNNNGYSSIKRTDGKMQTTLNGQPLYYFFKDEKAGDMKGQGLKDVWFTVKKSEMMNGNK